MFQLKIQDKSIVFDRPALMGILNVTPDSFSDGGRYNEMDHALQHCEQMLSEGADIIDVGGCSTRPGGALATDAEERERLRMALGVVMRRHPNAVVSVDTFRPEVARMAVEEFGAAIINDVSEGGRLTGDSAVPSSADVPEMFAMVARLRVPYVLTSVRPTLDEMLPSLAEEVGLLHSLGVSDILIDPGFGFGKDLRQNYQLMARLEHLHALRQPLLVGVSRKSMLWRLLDTTPEATLPATTALHAMALMKGASVLRVHDVAAAVQVCKGVEATRSCE
jgi:dihydropteroate synthase